MNEEILIGFIVFIENLCDKCESWKGRKKSKAVLRFEKSIDCENKMF